MDQDRRDETKYNKSRIVNRRFQIVIASPRANEAGNTYRLTRFARFKNLLAGLALITLALGVLFAALILGYLIAAILSIVVIVVIAVLFVKSFFRRRADRGALRRR